MAWSPPALQRRSWLVANKPETTPLHDSTTSATAPALDSSSDAETEFKAVSDTTPVAMWVRQEALIFHVEPSASGSMLTVSLRYERRLAPAWFFYPFMHTVAGLAVDVLARDTRDRAEPR